MAPDSLSGKLRCFYFQEYIEIETADGGTRTRTRFSPQRIAKDENGYSGRKMSLYKNEVPAGSLRPDKHEITDFKLDRFGELVSCETETENTGWVVGQTSGQCKRR